MNRYLLYACAAAIALGRIFIAPRLIGIPSIEGGYEAIAHLAVGFMILVPWYDRHDRLGPARLFGRIGWALALWELGWFLAQKFAV